MFLNCGVGEDSWESLGCKEIKPVHPKGNQSWVYIGRTDAEAEVLILWPPDAKNWLIGKDPNAGKDWRQEEKGTTEDETVGWHHWCDRRKFEQPPEIGDGQRSLACCSPWGRKKPDMTEWLNWTDWKVALNVHEFHLELCREGVIAPRQFVYSPEISLFLYKIVGYSVRWKILIIQKLIILPLHCLGYSSSWLTVSGGLFPPA